VIAIRPFTESDFPAIVRVFNACEPDSLWSEEDARHRDSTWDTSRYVRLRHVAELDGRVVGYGQISHHIYAFHPQKFTIHVMVESDSRHRGAGTALYEKLLVDLRARNAILVRCDLSQERTETLDFIAKRGFFEVARYWESRLDIARFEFARMAAAEQRAVLVGVTIMPVAVQKARHADWAQRIHALHGACSADEPQLDPPMMPEFENWLPRNVGSPFFLADASSLAIDTARDDAYVGMSLLYKSASPDVLRQAFTGVRRDYRGRGLALAMKLSGIRYASEHGIREIRTENDSLNVPMLRVNDTLGFVKQPESLTLQKDL